MLGEVRFDARGRGWTLVYTIGALAGLEQRTGRTLAELGAALARPPRRLVAELFAAGLVARHPELDAAAARRLMRALGRRRTGTLLGEALQAAFPSPDDPAAPEGRERPAAERDRPEGWLGLLSAWVECGGEPDAFWRQTPRLAAAVLAGRSAAAAAEFRARAWQAYQTAGLSRPETKLPRTFADWFREDRRKPRPRRVRTPDEQLAIARAWAARGIGTVQ